ncbi:unnamed protein product [Mytilus coruscus]|uniref:DNA helicase n=1 Tax=Mytilus coruscus TaxID=42192 RepID=A0A6J8E7Q7_MYTCO|nr:unnamed protein product [Mytilus coruscus]
MSVKLKKKLVFKRCDFSENVRPFAIICALHYLMRTSDLYKSSGIEINEDWITEIAKSNDEETQNQNNNTEQEDIQDQNDTDNHSDHFSEVDENETHVGNTDTLLDYIPDDNPPCQRPISLYSDPDAEYLSFPTIFCGKKRPDNKDRSVSVHYTDIVKWDLRSMDRRVAQSVPNIFFKLKKIQLKNISDKVNLALRRCKSDWKIWTAKDVLNPNTVGDIVRLEEVRHIGNYFSNSVETSAQEATYLTLQMPLTKATRQVVFINTSPPDKRTFLLKHSSALEKLESDNDIKRYSRRPKQLENWCLADYVSQPELQYPKTTESLDHETEQQENESESENEEANAGVIEENNNKINITLKNGIRIYQRKTPKRTLNVILSTEKELSDLQCGHKTYEKMYFTVSRLLEKKAKQYEGKIIDLEKAIEEAENDCNENDQIAPVIQQVEMEDVEIGPTESEQYVHFNPERPTEHRLYDMSREVGIEARTVELTNHANRISESDYFALIRSLNKKQWEFFQHVVTWVKTKHEPFYTFLTGGAGCGKSVVVKAIFQALHRHLCSTEGEDPDDMRILPCSPTGEAAWIFNDLSKGLTALAPNYWKVLFSFYELIEIMRQKDDLEFAQLLNRLIQNQLTENDFAVLSTRTILVNDPTYRRTNATHLFVENALVDNFNLQYISKLCSQTVKVKAVDTVCGDRQHL